MSASASSSSRVYMTAAAAALVGIAGAAYFYRRELLELVESATASPEMMSLINLSRAIRTLEATVTQLEHGFYSEGVHDVRKSTAERVSEFNKALAMAHSDVDFLFETLDSVRGDDTVRRRRKACVGATKDLSARVDKLVADYNTFREQSAAQSSQHHARN